MPDEPVHVPVKGARHDASPADALPRCPICSDPLQLVAADASPDTAPWVCSRDSRAYWEAELTVKARALRRAGLNDYGDGADGRAVLAAVLAELGRARAVRQQGG